MGHFQANHVWFPEGTILLLTEGSLEVKLPTMWTNGKAQVGSTREGKRKERRSKRKRQKEEDAGARKGRKDTNHCVFPMTCGSGRLKSRLAKAEGAEPSGRIRNEKMHAAVARSKFPSQDLQKHTMFGALLEVEMLNSSTLLWRETTFEV